MILKLIKNDLIDFRILCHDIHKHRVYATYLNLLSIIPSMVKSIHSTSHTNRTNTDVKAYQ
jgi:hypothetical protein